MTRLLILVVIALGLGLGVAWGGSQGGGQYNGIPIFILCAILAFVINWLAFIPAWLARTEHYYDLTGSLTYLSMTVLAISLMPSPTLRAKIAALLVMIWAVRLGSFLFLRTRETGGDGRFDKIKIHAARFFGAWTLQALWTVLTAACALAIITGGNEAPLGLMGYTGIALWVIGFTIEVTADRQKTTFRKNPENAGRFIQSGIWAWSQHPNYFGEILLWIGMTLLAIPVLSGWQWLVLASPVFVIFLLTKLSGIPTLQKRAQKKWGDDPAFQAYSQNTPLLIPRPPQKTS